MSQPETIAQAVRDRAGDTATGLIAGDLRLTHAEVVSRAAQRAAWLRANRSPGPFHVAVLLDNVPEFIYWLEAAALAGAVVVGANSTHRGDELQRDLTHTECQLLVTDSSSLPLVEGLRIGERLGTVTSDSARTLVLDTPDAHHILDRFAGATAADVLDPSVTPATLGYLLFTSGTSGAPKACLCTQGRMARIGESLAARYGLGPADVCYLAMPLFHSNALMAGWAPALVAASAFALPSPGRFSASAFLPDVRAAGATYFNYVGKPLAYILATPEQPDDADNPLLYVFGNEGSADDVTRFAERFDVPVTDAYGSTEGGATVARTPDSPPGALGRAPEGTVVLDAATGDECPRARFDPQGRLLNAEEAIGELVSKSGGAGFEGYWRNDEAEPPASKKVGTGPAIWPIATMTASSTSPDATTTGYGWTARISPPHPSSASCSAIPMWPWPSSTPCPIRWWVTRSWRPSSSDRVRGHSTPARWPTSWPPRPTSGPSGLPVSCA